MFTKESAEKIVQNARRLKIAIIGDGPFEVSIGVDREDKPIIKSNERRIVSRKDAILSICDALSWAQRFNREHHGDQEKEELLDPLIEKVKKAFETGVDVVLTRKFRFR